MASVVTSAVDFGAPNSPPIAEVTEAESVVNPNTEVEEGGVLNPSPSIKI